MNIMLKVISVKKLRRTSSVSLILKHIVVFVTREGYPLVVRGHIQMLGHVKVLRDAFKRRKNRRPTDG